MVWVLKIIFSNVGALPDLDGQAMIDFWQKAKTTANKDLQQLVESFSQTHSEKSEDVIEAFGS